MFRVSNTKVNFEHAQKGKLIVPTFWYRKLYQKYNVSNTIEVIKHQKSIVITRSLTKPCVILYH